MPRPRKDGKPSVSPVRVGVLRSGPRGSHWRVRAYSPTPGAPHGRVVYRRPGAANFTSAVPRNGQSLDDVFEQIEGYFNAQVALPSSRSTADEPRTITALGALYLARLAAQNRDPAYIANRRGLLTKHVYPVIGDLLVEDWSPDHSLEVRRRAATMVGPARLEDLGSTLSGLRAVARLKRPGGRWLAPTEDPLEGLSFSRGANVQGAHRNYIEVHFRPSTNQVRRAIGAAHEVGRWEWMPHVISLAAFCGLRLGEQLALRAIDVDLARRHIDVNGVWKASPAPRRGAPRVRFRHPHVKNRLRRIAPYAGSQHEHLVELCRRALALPPTSSVAEVVAVIGEEQRRRAAADRSGDWRLVNGGPSQEPWLFPDESEIPPTCERFNTAWHEVRDAADWDPRIPYKNLRHHAALWWRDLGFPWETIALWDGHDQLTLQRYYVLPAEDATAQARSRLDAQ
jgi:integrase